MSTRVIWDADGKPEVVAGGEMGELHVYFQKT
jgi:hypothetical protein